MQIRSVLGGYSDTSALTKKTENEEEERKAAKPAVPQPVEPTMPVGPQETLISILSQYDVTEITPTSYSEMIQQLRDQGVITDREFQELSTVRVDMDNEGIGPDEEIDLIQYYQERLQDLARGVGDLDSAVSSAERNNTLRRRLDWIEKFWHMQSAPESVGINTMA